MVREEMVAVKIKNHMAELTSYSGASFDLTGALQIFGYIGAVRDILH